jgi:hypothetical protein
MPVETIASPHLYQDLIDPQLFVRLQKRIADQEDISHEAAAQIVDASLGFLKMCADHPEHRFAPSPTVDIGWHTFILYTRDYALFCEMHAGRFLHHEPNDDPDCPSTARGYGWTIEFMREQGIPFDFDTWTAHLPDMSALRTALLTGESKCTVDCDGGKGGVGGGGKGGCS